MPKKLRIREPPVEAAVPILEPMEGLQPQIDWTHRTLKDLAGDPDKEDEYVCERLHNLRDTIAKIAESFDVATKDNTRPPAHFAEADALVLRRYIKRLCLEGDADHSSWLLYGPGRVHLVIGIISQALKHEVFDSLYFGGSPTLLERLHDLERGQVLQDGFLRARARADAIASDNTVLFQHAAKAEVKVVLQLWQLLRPFYGLDLHDGKHLKIQLKEVVHNAAALSREMRAKGDVIYFWPATFKDEVFAEERMECANLDHMFLASPFTESSKKNGWPILAPNNENNDQPVVVIISFPGLQSFRPGGGRLGEGLLREEAAECAEQDSCESEQELDKPKILEDAAKGLRTRTIIKALVHLKWGKQRLLTKEAGTTAHQDAVKAGNTSKYEEDYAGPRVLSNIGDAVSLTNQLASRITRAEGKGVKD